MTGAALIFLQETRLCALNPLVLLEKRKSDWFYSMFPCKTDILKLIQTDKNSIHFKKGSTVKELHFIWRILKKKMFTLNGHSLFKKENEGKDDEF